MTDYAKDQTVDGVDPEIDPRRLRTPTRMGILRSELSFEMEKTPDKVVVNGVTFWGPHGQLAEVEAYKKLMEAAEGETRSIKDKWISCEVLLKNARDLNEQLSRAAKDSREYITTLQSELHTSKMLRWETCSRHKIPTPVDDVVLINHLQSMDYLATQRAWRRINVLNDRLARILDAAREG